MVVLVLFIVVYVWLIVIVFRFCFFVFVLLDLASRVCRSRVRGGSGESLRVSGFCVRFVVVVFVGG